MSSLGCLITDPPQFTAPEHTAPFLLEATAYPPLGQVVQVDDAQLMTKPILQFSADVVSQDDSPTSNSPYTQIETRLYIDYGYTQFPGEPFLYFLGGTTIAGANLQTTQRQVSADWDPLVYTVSPGCHTATLVVSHIFDANQCPACADDYSMLTWILLRCNSGADPSTCNELPTTGPESCMGLSNSCAQVLADAGPDASACPEPLDGGAGGGGS